MQIDDSEFTDKDSKRPEYRSLYENSDNYIEAYSRHTDLRIKNDGPELAIGGQWEEHGPLQMQFLKDIGLAPDHKFLDFGCGTGRLARHMIPYLNTANYVGIDISMGALENCANICESENLWDKSPWFVHSVDGMLLPALDKCLFQYIWAHSVFTHLPPELIRCALQDIKKLLSDSGTFAFTYKKRDRTYRTGLKQFGYTTEWFLKESKKCGLVAKPLDERWPQGQSCIVVQHG